MPARSHHRGDSGFRSDAGNRGGCRGGPDGVARYPADAVREGQMATLKTDPARFEVVKNALSSAAEEMKIVLAKTAYSPLLKVAGDYSCGIFDIRGDMVAQGPDLPIHLGSR